LPPEAEDAMLGGRPACCWGFGWSAPAAMAPRMPVATARASRPRDARVLSFVQKMTKKVGSGRFRSMFWWLLGRACRRSKVESETLVQSGPLAPLWLQIWSAVVGETGATLALNQFGSFLRSMLFFRVRCLIAVLLTSCCRGRRVEQIQVLERWRMGCR